MAHTLQFEQTGVNPDSSFIHDNDSFRVQWAAENLGPDEAPEFSDRLVISHLPEGCPGSDDVEHTSVYDSADDGDPADFVEPPLPAGTIGPLMAPLVGPFPVGSYRLTVTIDEGGPNPVTMSHCIDIREAV
jgi:hypothetical protein